MDKSLIHNQIVYRIEELVDILKDLVAIPSPPGNEDRMLSYSQELLSSLGLATSWIYLEETELEKHPAFIPIGAREGRNLLAVWGLPKAEPRRYQILFNGHVDVVPPGEASNWTSPPYKAVERDDRIYGNGAADMKGGIACLMYVLRLLTDQGFKPAKPVAIELVIDEERLGNGTLANVLAGVSAEQAVFLEPSGSDRIVVGHRGSIMFRLILKGEGAELNSRGTSSDIVPRLFQVFKALQQWKAKRRQECSNRLGTEQADRAPVYFGRVAGGHWFSSPLAEIHIDGVCGYIPGERLESVKTAFHRHFVSIADLAPLVRSGNLIISMDRGFVEPSVTSNDGRLVKNLQIAAAAVLGSKPRVEHCENSGCDIRLRRIYDPGCQCVWYGPGGSRCHQSDESVSLDDLVKVSHVLAEWIIRECEI